MVTVPNPYYVVPQDQFIMPRFFFIFPEAQYGLHVMAEDLKLGKYTKKWAGTKLETGMGFKSSEK